MAAFMFLMPLWLCPLTHFINPAPLLPPPCTAVSSSSSSVAFCGIWRFRRWGGRHRGSDDSLILPKKSLPKTTIKGMCCMLLKHGVPTKLWLLICSRIGLLRLDLGVKTLSFIQCLSTEQKVYIFCHYYGFNLPVLIQAILVFTLLNYSKHERHFSTCLDRFCIFISNIRFFLRITLKSIAIVSLWVFFSSTKVIQSHYNYR